MKNKLIIASLLLFSVIFTACSAQKNETLQIANPASVFCVDHGGTLNIKDEAAGQVGYCTINGVECEEWSLYRGECQAMHICTDAEKTAEACTQEYLPVCGSDAKTYGNKCGACSAKVDYWTPGECK